MVSAPGRLRALLTNRHVHYVCRHHVFIIIVAAGLSGISGYLATRLTLNTNLADLLPEDYRSVQTLERIKEQVGHTRPHLVVVTSADLSRSQEFALALADSLRGSPLVSAISLRTNRDFFLKNRLLYMELADLDTLYSRFDDFLEQKKLEQSPLYFALDDEEEGAELDLSDLEERYRQEIEERGLNEESRDEKEQRPDRRGLCGCARRHPGGRPGRRRLEPVPLGRGPGDRGPELRPPDGQELDRHSGDGRDPQLPRRGRTGQGRGRA